MSVDGVSMKYRLLGKSGVNVSELCLGTMTFEPGTDEKESSIILDHFRDEGENFIDTADMHSTGKAAMMQPQSYHP
jgi:aryl-alcohol dehydrogenase-like predicted oxidoreductase